MIDLLNTFIQAGADIEDSVLHLYLVDQNERGRTIYAYSPFPNELAEWSGMLRRHGKDIKNDIYSSLNVSETLVPIEFFLACGIEPNHDEDPWNSLIFLLLYRAVKYFDKGESENAKHLSDLISAGADVYTIACKEHAIDDVFPDSPIVTPTMYAIDRDIESVWKLALRKAGFDPAEVYAEDERRRREFLRRQGATASAVEYEHLVEEEPLLRLRKRRVYDGDGLNDVQTLSKE